YTFAGLPAVKGDKLGGRYAGNRTRTFVSSNTPLTVSKCYSSTGYSVANWLGRCQAPIAGVKGIGETLALQAALCSFCHCLFPAPRVALTLHTSHIYLGLSISEKVLHEGNLRMVTINPSRV